MHRMTDDDRWPELNAGDPHMADLTQEGVTVYNKPSPIKRDVSPVGCDIRVKARDFGFFQGVAFVIVIDLLMLAIFEAWRVVPWLH